jgi:putative DNA methylase
MAKTKGKSKQELLTDQIASAVKAGREVSVETVDFSDPNRPKTCLEVDFPIIPINQIAAIEGNASKPIYQMSKWWARRRSSVFRSMLLSAAMKAPEDESKSAKVVWDVYYGNHQKRGSLKHLKVADPFMGGGTTVIEGSRLGMQMYGCDLNPVAWFVVKNEIANVDLNEVDRLLADVERELKPLITPYYVCDGPNGEKGKWFRRLGTKNKSEAPVQSDFRKSEMPSSEMLEEHWEELPPTFDIFSVPWQQRKQYRYEGPEITHVFWAKHGPCKREGCGHRTPIMSNPVIAVKTLTVEVWPNRRCSSCHTTFDVERYAARMSPDIPFVVAPNEKPFAVMDEQGRFMCPKCGKTRQDDRAHKTGNSSDLGKAKKKKVELSLLIHPDWLQGCPKYDLQGQEYGGSTVDSAEATVRWNKSRADKLALLEVRGGLPEEVTCPRTGVTIHTDVRGGTVPVTVSSKGKPVGKKGKFVCQSATCGQEQDVLDAVKATSKDAPFAAYAIQGYSPKRDAEGKPYGGRFFSPANKSQLFDNAVMEWDERKDSDLASFWPQSEIPFGHKTHERDPLPKHGFTHWWKMFNPRQLLIHAQLLKAILHCGAGAYTAETREYVLGAFQQYLRNQCMFTLWNVQADKMEPMFSNNNFNPKTTTVENCVFGEYGRGNWVACSSSLSETRRWAARPWELVSTDFLRSQAPTLASDLKGMSEKVLCGDPLKDSCTLQCGSSTDLSTLVTNSYDLVVTDPPFGDLLQYSEFADYFYVWLRLGLKNQYPSLFGSEFTPRALEVVSNSARQPENPDGFYQRLLTDCWREIYRILKPGGILAFTFHHSEDEPWVSVLTSLFDAGFYLENTFPIRSDETKGDNAEFGSQKIEYDIIHVCRKRIQQPQLISWARLRRQIMDDVGRLRSLLTQHQKAGLPAADLEVIKRGKALEYFSRHYGKVFIEQGREFTIGEALLGINQLLSEGMDTSGGPEAPPSKAEPFTRQFFRLFYETLAVPRDQMQKFLRGTGIAPSDFEERGWCSEQNRMFRQTPPIELARAWKGASRKGMARDFDQTMFLVGGCFEGSNIRVMDTLDSPNFAPHPATVELVDWLTRHGGSKEIKFAAQRAQTIYRDWLGKNKAKAQEQIKLFDLEN